MVAFLVVAFAWFRTSLGNYRVITGGCRCFHRGSRGLIGGLRLICGVFVVLSGEGGTWSFSVTPVVACEGLEVERKGNQVMTV